MGGEDEGYYYASEFLDAWKRVPGALDWFRAEAGKAAPPKAGRNEHCPCGSGKKSRSVAAATKKVEETPELLNG
jgi:hypothetical protein